jgi:hypothetical protein
MSDWNALDAELDCWSRAGRVATFWWRDDDACEPTPALSRLIALSDRYRVAIGLAVIPAKAGDALRDALTPYPAANVLQHGFAHLNHAPSNEKSAEYGAHRAVRIMSAELNDGLMRLQGMFEKRCLPLLVPPWNRISESLIPVLPSLGFRGLSAFSPRCSSSPAPGLRQVNTHADLIDWRSSRSFKGTARLAAEISAHLSARRRKEVDAGEPTGILSHHLVHDDDCWRFLQQLFARTRARENVQWLTAAEALES